MTQSILNRTFGHITVIAPTVKKYRQHAIWKCRCICGRDFEARADNIQYGNTKSCGCVRGPLDLSGQQVGKWQVIKMVSPSKAPQEQRYLCACSCRVQAVLSRKDIRKRNFHCGHKHYRGPKTYLKGKQIGLLTVLERTEKKNKNTSLWECKCQCGNKILRDTTQLNRGISQHCGCEQMKAGGPRRGRTPIDITGQSFGQLKALHPTDKRLRGTVIWKCKCQCGNTALVCNRRLRRGEVTDCGGSRSIT